MWKEFEILLSVTIVWSVTIVFETSVCIYIYIYIYIYISSLNQAVKASRPNPFRLGGPDEIGRISVMIV